MESALSLIPTVAFAMAAIAFGRRGGRRIVGGGDLSVGTMKHAGVESSVWDLPISVKIGSGVTLTKLTLYPRQKMMRVTFTPPRPGAPGRPLRHLPQNILSGMDFRHVDEIIEKFEQQEGIRFPDADPDIGDMTIVPIAVAEAAGLRDPEMPPYPARDADLWQVEEGTFDRMVESIQFRESAKMREMHYGRKVERANETMVDWSLQPGGPVYHALKRRRQSDMPTPMPEGLAEEIRPAKRVNEGPHPQIFGVDERMVPIVMPGHETWVVHNERRVACNLPRLPTPHVEMLYPGNRDGTWDLTDGEAYFKLDLKSEVGGERPRRQWLARQTVIDAFHRVREVVARHFPDVASRVEPASRCSECNRAREEAERVVQERFTTKFFFASGISKNEKFDESKYWVEESDGSLTPLGEIWSAMMDFASEIEIADVDKVPMSPRILSHVWTIAFDPNHSTYAFSILQGG